MPEKNGERSGGPNQPEETPGRQRRFIHEKIVRQPLTRRQAARRVLFAGACGLFFGIMAAAGFLAAGVAGGRFLGRGPEGEDSQITIPKDDPETTQATEPETTEQESQPVRDLVRSEIGRYTYTASDLERIYGGLKEAAAAADAGIVAVHSIQHQVDWFDNPIETTGQYAGIMLAKTEREALVLTAKEALESADSIEVCLSDGTVLPGTARQKDGVAGLGVVSVDLSSLTQEQIDGLTVVELGNSYSVKPGDVVVAVGNPAGIIHSMDYGTVSYVAKNVQMVDGTGRLFYTSASGMDGTFLIDLKGQLIGWVTEEYGREDGGGMTAAAAISDYKGILEDMSNGVTPPYFGIRGQEVSEAMAQSGLPAGIYVTDSVLDGPAYNAGIQNGDIITALDEIPVMNMKDFQSRVEDMSAGQAVAVTVQRNGKDAYTEIEFTVTVGAR